MNLSGYFAESEQSGGDACKGRKHLKDAAGENKILRARAGIAVVAAVAALVVCVVATSAPLAPGPWSGGKQKPAAAELKTISEIRKSIADARAAAGTALPSLVLPGDAAGGQKPPVSSGAGGGKQGGDKQGGAGGKGPQGKDGGGGQDAPKQRGFVFKAGKTDINVRGFRYIKYRKYGASGSSNSFMSRSGLFTYGKTIEQGSNIEFSAKQQRFELDGRIDEMPLQERTMSFDVKAGRYAAKLGDFTADLKGGSIVSLNKKITGVQVTHEAEKFKAAFVSSQSKSESRTVSFTGNNTHGPYDLKTFEILPGSVRVLLNGNELPAKSYDLDYFGGSITFCEKTGSPPACTNIKTSDRVQVIYEQKLLLSLKGGGIQGFKFEYEPVKGSSIGYATVMQQANRSAQRIRATKVESFSGDDLLALGPGEDNILRLSPISSKYPYQGQGAVFMVRSSETVTKNGVPLQRNVDYTVPYDGYGAGRINLARSAEAGASYTVSFSYYFDEFVNVSREEDILDTGDGANFYYLSKQTVYPGMETVLYCRGTSGRCDSSELLSPGATLDYTIDDTNNTIVIHSTKRPNAAENTFLRISYYYVPVDSPAGSMYDMKVSNVYGGYSFGDKLKISFERATSLSDISRTSVQIWDEIIVPAGAEVVCPNMASPPAGCVRQLSRENIEENSDTITIGQSGQALQRGVNYNIDASAGRITFMGGTVIPAGAAVYADFRFLPQVAIGLTGGKASNFRADSSGLLKGVNLFFSRDTADTTFTPVGGNYTLQTGRTQFGVNFPLGEAVAVSLNRNSTTNAEDVYGFFSNRNDSGSVAVSFTGKEGMVKKAELRLNTQDVTDDRPVKNMDNKRKQNALDVEIGVPIRKKEAQVSISRSGEKFNDMTLKTPHTKSGKTGLKFSYRPRPQLSLDFALDSESVSADGLTERYSSRTTTRNFDISYQPNKLVTLAGNMKTQSLNEGRPGSTPSSVNETAIRLTTMPYKKFRTVAFSITQQDSPSQFTGGSKNSVRAFSFTYDASKSVALTPSLTTSKFGSSTTGAKTDTTTLKMEYLPRKKKFEAVMIVDSSKTKSSSAGVSGSSSNRGRTFDARYKLSEHSNVIYRHTNIKGSVMATSSSSGNTRNSIQYVRNAGERLKISTQYSMNSTRGEFSNRENVLDINSDYKVSRFVTWRLNYNLSKFKSPSKPEDNYSGNLLETMLNMAF